MRFALFFAWILSTQVLTGCAAYRPDDLGIQNGVVRKIYLVGETPSDYPECLVTQTADQRSGGRYVEVEFMKVGSKRYVNSFVSEEAELKLNDKVLVGSPYCIGSHKPEIILKKN